MNLRNFRRSVCPCAGLIAALLATPAVTAQEALEEIIVTATKREQSMQDIGISVTAYSGEQMKEMGITNSTDLTAMTPGLQYTVPNAEGSQINFFLRGVGLNDFADANENPVATYVDDVYRGAMGGLNFQLFDMERAEVLRGPQGTLYGRNTTGGLIHFISRKPTDTFEGYGDFTYGSYDTVQFEGAVSGPIPMIDGLKARLSGAVDNHDGYVSNESGPDYNSVDAYALRLQLQYDPNEDFSALVNVHGSFNDGQVGAWQHQSTKPGPDGNVELPANEDFWGTCAGCDVFGYRDNDNNPWHGEFDRDGRVVVDSWGLSGKFDWRINNVTLTSITAFEKVSRLQEEDTDATPFPLLNPTFGADTDQITQEFRIAGGEETDLRWQGGFYYFHNEVDANYLLDLTNLGFVYFDANYLQETESWSVFGNVEYDFAPQWTVVAGVRYTEEDKDLDYTNVDLTGLYGFLTGIGAVPLTPFRPNPDDAFIFNSDTVGNLAKHEKSNISGKIEVDYKPTDDLLLYGSFSRGVKSAGFNTGFLDGTFIFASNTPATIPYDDETLHAFEVGVKSTLFGGTTRFNASAFYYDYQDFQTFRFELLNQIIFNTDAEVYGAEFELITSPWDGWDFMFGLALLDATAEDIPDPVTGAPRDRTMVSAPDVTFNGMARYSWPMFGGTMAAVATMQYQDATYFDIQNHPISRENGYLLGNLRLQWTSPTERWHVAAFVNNIADEEYLTYTFDFTSFGFNQQAYGKPRWFGGTVGFNWQ